MGPIQTAVGLEIVDSALQIAVLQSRFGRVHLLRSVQIPEFETLSNEDKRNAVAVLVKQHGLGRAKAFLALPRKLGILRQTELPVEVADRARSAIALQVESLSPWSSDEIYWDCAWESPAKGDRTIRITIGIIPRTAVDPLLDVFRSAGLPLAGVSLSSVAQAHAAVVRKSKSPEDARTALATRSDATLDEEHAAATLGFGKSGFNLNLIPESRRHRTGHLELVPTYALVAILALLGVAAVAREPYQWAQYGVALDSEIAQLAPEVSAVSAQEAEFSKITTDFRALKARIEARDQNLEALRELGRVLPPDSFITSYNVQGRNVSLSGFAQNASVVQKTLEESPIFEDVQFASSVLRDSSGKDRFSIKARTEVSQ